MVKRYPSKLDMRVRFPLPAPVKASKENSAKKYVMKSTVKYLFLTSALGIVSLQAQSDCSNAASAVQAQVSEDKSEVLNVVAAQVEASPNCACEIVKTAISASEADNATVGAIVEAAANAAPEKTCTHCSMRYSRSSRCGPEYKRSSGEPWRGSKWRSI